MCGRIVQKRNINDYLEKIIRAPTPEEIFRADLDAPRTLELLPEIRKIIQLTIFNLI